VKRFFVAIPTLEGSVELFPMKEWLRQHPESIPAGLDATHSTSHELRRGLRRSGWTIQELDSEVRLIRPSDADREDEITELLGPDSADEDEQEDSQASEAAFALEHQLRDFLAENLSAIPVAGLRVHLYVDPAGRDGVEYPTAVGPIDLLGVADSGAFVVFELKRARAPDRAIGQLTRYMGWVKHTIGRGHEVQGVVVARTIDERLRYAATVIPGVSLLEYSVEFRLKPAHEIAENAVQ
jgi:hypothetical protein